MQKELEKNWVEETNIKNDRIFNPVIFVIAAFWLLVKQLEYLDYE